MGSLNSNKAPSTFVEHCSQTFDKTRREFKDCRERSQDKVFCACLQTVYEVMVEAKLVSSQHRLACASPSTVAFAKACFNAVHVHRFLFDFEREMVFDILRSGAFVGSDLKILCDGHAPSNLKMVNLMLLQCVLTGKTQVGERKLPLSFVRHSKRISDMNILFSKAVDMAVRVTTAFSFVERQRRTEALALLAVESLESEVKLGELILTCGDMNGKLLTNSESDSSFYKAMHKKMQVAWILPSDASDIVLSRVKQMQGVGARVNDSVIRNMVDEVCEEMVYDNLPPMPKENRKEIRRAVKLLYRMAKASYCVHKKYLKRVIQDAARDYVAGID
jgi:hypothetical protein